MQPTQNPANLAGHPTRRLDGKPETDADRRFFDLRNAGYTGPINQDGYPVDDTGARVVVAVCGECGLVSTPDEVVCWYCESEPADLDELDDLGELDDDYYEQSCDTVAPATPAITLRAAARYLDRHGWIQGAYYDATTGSFTPAACMVGAIAIVCYGGPVDAPAQLFDHPGFAEFEAALAWLDRSIEQRWGMTGYEFNDTRGRVAADVVVELLHAAKLSERTNGGAS